MRFTLLCGASAATLSLLAPHAQAAAPGFVPPPLSTRTSAALAANPAAREALWQRLATQSQTPAASSRFTTTTGGTWAAVATAPAGLTSPLLLTDGTVIAADGDTARWYKLTPDANGNYATGHWAAIASLPVIGTTQYAPLYHASAVLPDGRAIIMGGEYNGTGTEVWTSLGAIYDPVANSWSAVAAPSGSSWKNIGDAESIVLANGQFMLGACCADPTADAILNPLKLSWSSTNGPAGDNGAAYQDEQGYELLPNGKVLTIDVWANGVNATNTELYTPKTKTWASAGSTPVSLVDPTTCGNYEIGPAVLRGDGTLVAFGGNTGCVSGATTDPTAIYNVTKSTWTAGPSLPATCGSASKTACTMADAPAALEPDGAILMAASAGYGNAPTHFFEFLPNNTIQQVSDPLHYSGSSGSYYYNFLVLPNGQILMTDFSAIAEVYTPASGPAAGLAPLVTTTFATLTHGNTYKIQGKQLSGRSQGAYYGDDAQMATNYPLVRLTITATGHVFYARTTGISSESVAAKAPVTANFTVPATIETGAATLQVVANGIASTAQSVTIN